MLRVFFFILALGLTTAAGGHAEPGGPMGQGCYPNCP